MKFIKLHFEKIVLGLLLILMVQQCNNSSKIAKVEKQEKLMNQRIDSVYTSDLKKMIEVEGLKASKRTLYDWNSVIRTTVRPDDRMNQYDLEIEKIRNSK
mgnify:CR=1 FL=1|jgi:hypothetical protein